MTKTFYHIMRNVLSPFLSLQPYCGMEMHINLCCGQYDTSCSGHEHVVTERSLSNHRRWQRCVRDNHASFTWM